VVGCLSGFRAQNDKVASRKYVTVDRHIGRKAMRETEYLLLTNQPTNQIAEGGNLREIQVDVRRFL